MWGSPGPKRLTHRRQSQVGGSCKDWKYGLTGKLKILGLLYHPFFCAHPIKMLRQNKPGSGLNGHGVKLLPAPAWSCVFNFSHTLNFSYWSDCSLLLLGKCAPQRMATERCKKIKFWKLWEHLFSASVFVSLGKILSLNFFVDLSALEVTGCGKYYNLSADKMFTWPVAPLGEAKWLWRFSWYRNNRKQHFASSGKRRHTNADIDRFHSFNFI